MFLQLDMQILFCKCGRFLVAESSSFRRVNFSMLVNGSSDSLLINASEQYLVASYSASYQSEIG
jgi:hypothetical protein